MWVRHLALCATAGETQNSVLIGRGDGDAMASYRLRSVDEATAQLAELVKLYRMGMREPLLLFPRTAFRYAQAKRSRGVDDEAHRRALRAAGKAWSAEQSYDAYIAKLYGGETLEAIAARRPEDDGFAAPGFVELTERVFTPLLDHLEDA
jgi:exonuclease V gamma subunit